MIYTFQRPTKTRLPNGNKSIEWNDIEGYINISVQNRQLRGSEVTELSKIGFEASHRFYFFKETILTTEDRIVDSNGIIYNIVNVNNVQNQNRLTHLDADLKK